MANATTNITTGWNLGHCYTAVYYFNYIYAFNLEGSYWYTNSISGGATLLDVCRTGQLYGVYVYDSAGDWGEIWDKW